MCLCCACAQISQLSEELAQAQQLLQSFTDTPQKQQALDVKWLKRCRKYQRELQQLQHTASELGRD